MANPLDDLNFGEFNKDSGDFLTSLQSISLQLNEILKANKEITSEFGAGKTNLKGVTDLATELASISKKRLRTEKQVGEFGRKIERATKQRAALQQKILSLEKKLANATSEERKGLKKIIEAKLRQLDVANDIVNTGEEILDNAQQQNFTFRSIGNAAKAALGVFAAFKTTLGPALNAMLEIEGATLENSKQLGISKEEAFDLQIQLNDAAIASNNMAVTSTRLLKSQKSLNDAMGTGLQFSMDTLSTMTTMTSAMGLSEEAAVGFAKMAESSGMSAEQLKVATLDIAGSLQQQTGIQLDNRRILEDVSKVSGELRANLGNNPQAIAAAVTQAKLLGGELEDVNTTAKALLDFESSIESELRAELITGKQLNLERARSLALAGKDAELAEELKTQLGSQAEFMKLNVLQRQELASAFGLSADRMSDMLQNQEIQKANAQSLRGLTGEQIAAELEQLSTQDKLAVLKERFLDTAAALVPVILPAVEAFGSIVDSIAKSKSLLIGLVSVMAGFKAATMAIAIANIFSANAKFLGPLGLATGLATTAAMVGAISSAQSVADGVAPAGNGPFTITDGYGRTAITARGDGLAVSPNINNGGGGGQPVVIQNTFSNFQASGPYQLAETQRRQASPTFA